MPWTPSSLPWPTRRAVLAPDNHVKETLYQRGGLNWVFDPNSGIRAYPSDPLRMELDKLGPFRKGQTVKAEWGDLGVVTHLFPGDRVSYRKDGERWTHWGTPAVFTPLEPECGLPDVAPRPKSPP